MGALRQEAEILAAGRTLDRVPVKRLVEMLDWLERPDQIATFFRGLSRGRATANALVEAWINGLLSNPVTHAVNAMSNAVVATFGVAERSLAVNGRMLASRLGLAREVNGVVRG